MTENTIVTRPLEKKKEYFSCSFFICIYIFFENCVFDIESYWRVIIKISGFEVKSIWVSPYLSLTVWPHLRFSSHLYNCVIIVNLLSTNIYTTTWAYYLIILKVITQDDTAIHIIEIKKLHPKVAQPLSDRPRLETQNSDLRTWLWATTLNELLTS